MSTTASTEEARQSTILAAPAPVATLEQGSYDAIVVAVAHNEFKAMGLEAIRALGKPGAVLYDVKAMFPQGAADLRL